MSGFKKKTDVFSDIAARGSSYRGTELECPVPLALEEKLIKLKKVKGDIPAEHYDEVNDSESLQVELLRMRQKYAQFMCDFTPSIKSYRNSKMLSAFEWRVETDEDKHDFLSVHQGLGSWREINVPHYGGPLGSAVTYYRKVFELVEADFYKSSLFICFKGIDYKASVFINGYFVGTHEGFFAPFEFEFSEYARKGENTILIKVDNDYICFGSESEKSNGILYHGDKIYAATGLGYDDSEFGWHHCPPGMGIYQEVCIETRPRAFISDIFLKPEKGLQSAEAWVEVYNCDIEPIEIKFSLSLYGKNFENIVFEKQEHSPATGIEVGVGDSYTEAILKAEGKLNGSIPLLMEKGRNRFIIPLDIKAAKVWSPENPWMYQLQVSLIIKDQVADTGKSSFGMRSFEMDIDSHPKGMFYLNGEKIRLRGANTMGHEQQCVYKKDFEQLRDDILLARICNMNFLRITQRPVQPEIYEYCDMLGMLIQTDLPLFGVFSRNQFCEGIRQAEEMERLIRSHPSCIMVSYINEPQPNAANKPQRYLTRNELESFFKACDLVVKLNNPDRVIKYVDGDYDPPSDSFPDNHCYPCWYNGHGIDIGRLNKGYWLPVKPDWYYGCGEYGAEGLDPEDVMRCYYPKEWLPSSQEEEKNWTPSSIRYAQTGKFHYFFYDTQDTLKGWVEESQKHQAWATRMMTEAFRRSSRMQSIAIHLFIDAFPSGWMKAIMDFDRKPKPAYFAYRAALEPLMVSIRTDRYKFFAGEEIKLEAWVCNDKEKKPENTIIKYQVEMDGKIISDVAIEGDIPSVSSIFQGFISFTAPNVKERKMLKIHMILKDADGSMLTHSSIDVETFPDIRKKLEIPALLIGSEAGTAKLLGMELGLIEIQKGTSSTSQVILVDDYNMFKCREQEIKELVEKGARLIFLELPEGNYKVLGYKVTAKNSGMLPLHFASRKTGHRLVEGMQPDDIRLWYEKDCDMITPLLDVTIKADDFIPALLSGNTDEKGEWGPALAAAEKAFGDGCIRICQVKLAGRVLDNPTAYILAKRLIEQ